MVRRKKYTLFLIITRDPSIYALEHPELTVSNFMEWDNRQIENVADFKDTVLMFVNSLPLEKLRMFFFSSPDFFKVRNVAKIRNRCNQVPHLT